MSGGDVDFVSLYYRVDMSLDEDEFSELAANCTAPCKRALGDLEQSLLLDRHCVVQGVFVQFEALARELNPFHVPARCVALWSPLFGDLLTREPALAIAVLQTAIHTLLFTIEWNKNDDVKRRVVVPRNEPVQVHVCGFRPLVPFRALKSNALGQFVTVRGTVVRVSGVRPIVRRMNFECARCGEIQAIAFQDGKFNAPGKCVQCKAKTMVAKRTDADSVDWQNISLQEIVENRSSGRVPRTLECEATGALVDRCVPGDIVCVSGIVKMVAADINEKAGGRDNAKNSMYVIYVDANYVDNAHVGDESADKMAEKSDIVEFTAKELAGIRAIMQHASPLNLIVNSLCPAIWGHELVKLGLCLALVGGVTKNSNARDKMPLRGDIHVLVVGDPGLGKSQLLRAVNTVSPRGVYVSGGYSTTAGLTVTVLKEKGTGDFVLEAGALVLGDQGIAAIDEFDKMRPQHAALLEAMEQQMISIAKAGIACSLPARTSVIAAANPVDGHFDHAKTVAENLCMAGPMLSRFDMIFLLLDRADATRDMMLSEHIMDIHGAAGGAGRVGGAAGAGGAGGAAASAAGHAGEQASLRDRLLPPAQFSSLPPPLLRKYICYVRRYVRPVLTPPAASVLKDCFLRLRAEAARAGADSIPVTTRTLEALVRLAEARAKIEGREQVTVADAYDVVELYDQTLPVHASAADAFDPAASGLPTVFNGGAAGETAARRQKAALTKELKMFAQGVRQFATRLGRKQFTTDELRSLAVEGQFNAILADFSASLDQLNARGEFLKRRNDQSQAVEWQVM